MKLEIATNDPALIQLLEACWQEPEDKLPDGMDISKPVAAYKDDRLHGFTVPEIVSFTLTFAAGIGGNLIAAWIWETFQSRVRRIKLDGIEVGLTEEEIRTAVEEYLARRVENQQSD